MTPTRIRRPPFLRLARCILAFGVASLPATCSRGIGLDAAPGPTYTVEVVNPTSDPLIVSYDDGSGERLLGTVPAHRNEWFTIAGPAGRTVSIIATDRDRARTTRTSIALRAAEPTRVVLSR